MPRPRGRIKTSRISVSFEPGDYETLVLLAKREDVPVSQLIRRAVNHFISAQRVSQAQAELPLVMPPGTPSVMGAKR